MTRADILKLFPDATDEQITNLLNSHHKEIAVEKDKNAKLKASADLSTELQAQLDNLNAQNLSDIEKANKETEKANKRVADLEREVKNMQIKASLASLGIVGEEYDNFFKEDGNINFDNLSTIISKRENDAIARKEKELLASTGSPKGNTDGTDATPLDVENAKKLNFGNNAVSQDTKDYYVIK